MPFVLFLAWILAIFYLASFIPFAFSPEVRAYENCNELIRVAMSSPSINLMRARVLIAAKECKSDKVTTENLIDISKTENFADMEYQLQNEYDRR